MCVSHITILISLATPKTKIEKQNVISEGTNVSWLVRWSMHTKKRTVPLPAQSTQNHPPIVLSMNILICIRELKQHSKPAPEYAYC